MAQVKKILILSANPKDTARLRLDEEVREIENGLKLAHDRGGFELKHHWATRPQDIRRTMLEFRPNIVHFSGHGEGDAGVVFENELGQAHLVSAEALSDFFELFKCDVNCVILNACYSEIQAKAIARHISYVIGMNQAIGDKASIEFAVGFYDALVAGKSIEESFRFGRNAVQLRNIAEEITPVLVKMPTVEMTSESLNERRQQSDAYKRLIEQLKAQWVVQNDERLARRIADECVVKTIKKGEELINQGDGTDSVFFIVKGTVDVFIDDRKIGIRTAKQTIGEMAAIDPTTKRCATIIAAEEIQVAELSEQALSRVASEYPELWRNFAREIADRLRELPPALSPKN
jgi:CRP-like cAMP-binding protein